MSDFYMHFIILFPLKKYHMFTGGILQSLLFFFPLIIKTLNPDSYILLTPFFWNGSGDKEQSKQHF